jgi:hypothetical protein
MDITELSRLLTELDPTDLRQRIAELDRQRSALAVSPDYVRDEIRAGRLGAIDTSRQRCRRPRYIVLPHHLTEWEQSHAAATLATKQPRQKKRINLVDYYPD